MLDRWQQQCQLISTACRLRGGAGVIGVQRAQTGAANCWPLRERERQKGEHGKRDTYELERLPSSCPDSRPDTSCPGRAPASLAVVARCDAGKTWVER